MERTRTIKIGYIDCKITVDHDGDISSEMRYNGPPEEVHGTVYPLANGHQWPVSRKDFGSALVAARVLNENLTNAIADRAALVARKVAELHGLEG